MRHVVSWLQALQFSVSFIQTRSTNYWFIRQCHSTGSKNIRYVSSNYCIDNSSVDFCITEWHQYQKKWYTVSVYQKTNDSAAPVYDSDALILFTHTRGRTCIVNQLNLPIWWENCSVEALKLNIAAPDKKCQVLFFSQFSEIHPTRP